MEILRLTGQPKVDLAALKQCLAGDPALVGKILRVVNSSLFGVSREVADLGQALNLLGTKSVRLIVLGFSLPDELFLDLAGNILQRYWHHTVVKAAAAREIAETIYRIPGEEPFIAGLLQDIGILVLLQQLGEPYMRFLDRALGKGMDVDSAEAVALGFEHEQLSARLLERWGLPDSMVSAIAVGRSEQRLHQLPANEQTVPQILQLAHLVAELLTTGRTSALERLERSGRDYKRMTRAQISTLVESLQSKVGQLAEVLSLQLPPGVDYLAIYSSAHRQLSAVAEEVAGHIAQSELTAKRQREAMGIEHEILSASTALSEAAHQFLHEKQAAANSTSVKSSTMTQTTTKESAVRSSESSKATTALMVKPTETKVATLPRPAGIESQSTTALTRPVQAAVDECRKRRQPLTLVLIEVDRFAELSKKAGAAEAGRLVQLVNLLCGRMGQPHMTQLANGPSGFALILPNCDRPSAAEIGNRLVREVRRLCEKHSDLADSRLSISIGVATTAMPAKNFTADALIAPAQRCLNAAQLSSGNSVKTVDVL